MPIKFPCPKCKKKLRDDGELVGRKARCPHCPAIVVVPTAAVAEQIKRLIDKYNRTDFQMMMFDAATEGYLKVMKWLKKNDVKIDERVREGDLESLMPIHIAVLGGHESVVEWLLDEDENLVNAPSKNLVNAPSKSGTPMHHAAATGQDGMMKLLKRRKGNVNGEADNGMKPIHFAATRDKKKSLECLVEELGVSVNERAGNGMTPLHVATMYNSTESIKYLVEDPDTDVNAGDAVFGKPPLFLAASLDQIEGMKCLYKFCTDLNRELNPGLQALKRFAEAGNWTRVIRWLDEKGIQ